MLKALGIIMFITPFFILIKNIIQTTNSNKKYLWEDLELGIVALAIASIYWGLAGFLLGK